MDIKAKLEILADAAKYDASCSSSGSHRKRDAKGLGNVEGMGICHSYTPDGRCVSLLKILLTNNCIYDCRFCINRMSSETPRAKFTVDEVVWLTMEFYRRNYIEGLFLSSGIIQSVDYTMEQITEVARKLREIERFGGYIHLKVVPGASQEMIEKAGKYADRVSANMELPTQGDLDKVATAKTVKSVFDSMSRIQEKVSESKEARKKLPRVSSHRPWAEQKTAAPKQIIYAPAGQTTQMIVGATQATDQTLLDRSQQLYSEFNLRRVYYSAYSPIPNADAILPVERPSLIRENRLYQADWLIRFYGFKSEELTDDSKTLSLDLDPKTSWALRHRAFFPVDINTAPKEALLRIPGIGVRNVERILQVRRFKKVTLDDLRKLRVSIPRTKYFVVTADHNPDVLKIDHLDLASVLKPKKAEQLSLFSFNQIDNPAQYVSTEVVPDEGPKLALTGEF